MPRPYRCRGRQEARLTKEDRSCKCQSGSVFDDRYGKSRTLVEGIASRHQLGKVHQESLHLIQVVLIVPVNSSRLIVEVSCYPPTSCRNAASTSSTTAFISSPSARAGPRSDHSMTWSAPASSDGGMVSPSVLAVFWLMIRSNFVGCSIGRSPGLAPFRILLT